MSAPPIPCLELPCPWHATACGPVTASRRPLSPRPGPFTLRVVIEPDRTPPPIGSFSTKHHHSALKRPLMPLVELFPRAPVSSPLSSRPGPILLLKSSCPSRPTRAPPRFQNRARRCCHCRLSVGSELQSPPPSFLDRVSPLFFPFGSRTSPSPPATIAALPPS
jgi:hypothetical protein